MTSLSVAPKANQIQPLLDLLEKIISSHIMPTTIFVPLIYIINSMLATFPGVIWTYLRGSALLFPLGTSAARSAWTTRKDSSGRSILQEDKKTGMYASTLAVLDLVRGLFLEAQRSVQTNSHAFAEIKNEVLKRAIRWVTDSVWASFSAWRYVDVRQKFQIGAKVAMLFGQILEEADCGGVTKAKAVVDAVELVEGVLLINASAARLAPLLDLTSSGPDIIIALNKSGKKAEAMDVEICVEANLYLIYRLLSLTRHILPNQPSLLEGCLFSHGNQSVPKSSKAPSTRLLISTLFTYIASTFAVRLATHSAHILARLAYLSQDWGVGSERPSLLGHLGGAQECQDTIDALLAIAEDPFIEVDVQIATWDLLVAAIESQPSLAAMLVTGSQAWVTALAKEQKNASSTAATLAVKVLHGWEEAWNVQPAILSSSLRCLTQIWKNYNDYRSCLQSVRMDSTLWAAVSSIISKQVDVQQDSGSAKKMNQAVNATEMLYNCYRLSAQAEALQLLASDIEIQPQETISSPSDPSLRVLIHLLGDKEKFTRALAAAMLSPLEPSLFTETETAFKLIFKGLHLDAYRKPSSNFEVAKRYGKDFFYNADLIRNRVEGCHSQDIDESVITNAIQRIEMLNIAWSIFDAHSSLLVSWNVLLETALPKIPHTQAVGNAMWTALLEVATSASKESRTGEVIQRWQAIRLNLLQIILREYIVRPSVTASPSDLCTIVNQIRLILTNEHLDPILSLKMQQASAYHRVTFQTAFLVFRKFSVSLQNEASIPMDRRAQVLSDIEASVGVALTAVQVCITLVTATTASELLSDDLSLVTSLVQQILNSPFQPRQSVWLAVCQELNLFRCAFDFLSSTPVSIFHSAHPLHLLNLLLSLAIFPQVAEKMALNGLVSALNSNALTIQLEEGLFRPNASEHPGAISLAHKQWCLMNAVMTQLVSHLGGSIPFMDNEALVFLRLYAKQLKEVFLWSTSDPLTIDVLREMHDTSTLLRAIVSSKAVMYSEHPVIGELVHSSLFLLQQLVYLLQHPNLLSTLLDPVSAEERIWLQSDSTFFDSFGLIDLPKRPVAASILQEVLMLCQILISTLVTYTQAFAILTKENIDWPSDRIIMQAVSLLYMISAPDTGLNAHHPADGKCVSGRASNLGHAL